MVRTTTSFHLYERGRKAQESEGNADEGEKASVSSIGGVREWRPVVRYLEDEKVRISLTGEGV